ncbi:hypothetical protein HMI55_001138 [Coelomomyces lativittatus]|nr:hypothetical protein HMI55_001138 [Coelomomyces lativittatus]
MQKYHSTLKKILENFERKHVLPALETSEGAKFAVAEYIAKSENAESLAGTTSEETKKLFDWCKKALACRSNVNEMKSYIKVCQNPCIPTED